MAFSFYCSYSKLRLIAFVCFFATKLDGAYIEHYSTIDNGGITFTENAFGFSKYATELGKNDPIDAYLSVSSSLTINDYSTRVTFNFIHNSSDAVLDLPAGNEVLYAEFI